MSRKNTLFAVGGIVALAAAWGLFRPELLFVNEKVNEALPPAAAAAGEPLGPIAAGAFKSLAHETSGAAEIHKTQAGDVLRLTNFKTSNGPALHVYLVRAASAPDDASVKKAGFIDLGKLKGNIGDQNYPIPVGTDLSQYGAVSIWCARFNVNFGSASLNPAASASGGTVASGTFRGLAHETAGSASILDLGGGRRVLRLSDFKTSNGPALHVYLVRAEDAPNDASVKQAGFLDLGKLKGNVGDQNYEIPAGTDLNGYRAVSIWCARFGVNFGAAALR